MRLSCLRLFALAAAALATTPATAQLTETERAMAACVEAGFEQDVALLERIVVQNSGTHNHDGVRKVAHMLAPEFEALGFKVEWIDQSAAGRTGHLFARHEGKPGTTRMLLIAHMDTVFEPDSGFEGFVREGDIAIGPGVGDDKGGIVIILAALRAIKAAGTLDDANIVVALTGDEEEAGDPVDIARADLVKAAEWADVALDFEGLSLMDGRDMAVIARRSANNWTLRVTAGSGHSSGIFGEGASYGAIYELARILDRFRQELPEENLTLNVGSTAGGTPAEISEDGLSVSAVGKTNIIPSSAVARGDLRTISIEQTDRIAAAMQAIVDDNLPGTDATIEFAFRYPPMPPTEGNLALFGKLNAVSVDMGLSEMGVYPPAGRGAGDINFVAHLVDGIAGLGPGGTRSHAPGETINLQTLTRQAQRAAVLMSRLATEQGAGD